jgi:membrane-associated phospholipid phosphatase
MTRPAPEPPAPAFVYKIGREPIGNTDPQSRVTALRSTCTATCLLVVVTTGAVSPARAQSNSNESRANALNTRVDSMQLPRASRPPLFGRRDLLFLGGALAATAMVMPLDRGITGELNEGPQRSGVLQSGADFFNTVGQPGVVVFSLGTFALGHVIGSPSMSDVGLHASLAVLSTGLVTAGIKSVVGRQRPALDMGNSRVYGLGAGLGNNDRSSFPSGHTSVAFALATVMSSELERLHPGSNKWARPLFYGGAGLVGLARIYDARHWTSDVVLGAGLGTLIGMKVTQLAHSHDAQAASGFLRTLSVGPADGGVRIGWTLPAR